MALGDSTGYFEPCFCIAVFLCFVETPLSYTGDPGRTLEFLQDLFVSNTKLENRSSIPCELKALYIPGPKSLIPREMNGGISAALHCAGGAIVARAKTRRPHVVGERASRYQHRFVRNDRQQTKYLRAAIRLRRKPSPQIQAGEELHPLAYRLFRSRTAARRRRKGQVSLTSANVVGPTCCLDAKLNPNSIRATTSGSYKKVPAKALGHGNEDTHAK